MTLNIIDYISLDLSDSMYSQDSKGIVSLECIIQQPI